MINDYTQLMYAIVTQDREIWQLSRHSSVKKEKKMAPSCV